MKKTLLFTIDYPPIQGGVANYYKNICANLPSDKVVVLANHEVNEKNFDNNQKYKIYRRNLITNFPIWPRWLLSFYHLRQVIKKEKIDIILVGQILPLGTVCYIYKKVFKIPYGVFVHGMDIKMAQSVTRKRELAKKILNNAEFIIANSEYTKNLLLKQGIKSEKIEVVYPGVELKSESPEEVLAKNTKIQKMENIFSKSKIILTLGRLVKRKGQDMVLKSLSYVLEKFPNLVYIIAGNGPDKSYLKNLIKELSLENNVIIDDNVSEEEKAFYYKKCHIFIMPSREIKGDVEGFGIVYLEAGLYSKPVIAGKSGGAMEAVLDNETGILVNPESPEEIGEAIIKLLTNPNLMNKLGVQGQKRVLNKFIWEKQIEKIFPFLD